MQQAHLYISGFVQGVGYRQFVRREAEERGLTGWVRNLPDGRVEAVLQGEKSSIKQIIDACRKGPFLAEIDNVEAIEEEVGQTFESFEVK